MGKQIGGIILCGGQSKRMGQSKHLLPFGSETLVERAVHIISQTVSPIIVVAAAEQDLPALPAEVAIIRDNQPYRGPLYGLLAGLSHLQDHCEAAFLSGCDVPLLKQEFVLHMIAALQDYDIAIPKEQKFYHPLAVVYRTALHSKVAELIETGHSRPFDLIQFIHTLVIPVDELRAVDPQLDSLHNFNTPEEYQQTLSKAGI